MTEELQEDRKEVLCAMCKKETTEPMKYNGDYLCPECVEDLGSYN